MSLLLLTLSSFAVDLDRVELGWGQTVTVNNTVVACQVGPAVQVERRVFKKSAYVVHVSCEGATAAAIATAAERLKNDGLSECFEAGFNCTSVWQGGRTQYLAADTQQWTENMPAAGYSRIQCSAVAVVHGEKLRTQ